MENVKIQPIYVPSFGKQGAYIVPEEDYNEYIKYKQEKLLMQKLNKADEQITKGEIYTKEELKTRLGIKWKWFLPSNFMLIL